MDFSLFLKSRSQASTDMSKRTGRIVGVEAGAEAGAEAGRPAGDPHCILLVLGKYYVVPLGVQLFKGGQLCCLVPDSLEGQREKMQNSRNLILGLSLSPREN